MCLPHTGTRALASPAADAWCPLLRQLSQNLQSLVLSLGWRRGERQRPWPPRGDSRGVACGPVVLCPLPEPWARYPQGPIPPEAPPGSVTEGGRKSVWPSAFVLSASTRGGRTRDGVGQAAGERPAGSSARRPPPGRAQHCPSAPEELPLRELKPYTSGCLASRPGANTSPFSLPFLPRAAGASLAGACSARPRGRGRFRPGVFCHGPVLLLTGRAWSHAGSCHTRERVPTSRSLVLSPVRSGASPGAGCRSGLPGHLPGLGPRPPCPPAGSRLPSIQRALCLPCLNLGPGPGAPPLTQPLQTD